MPKLVANDIATALKKRISSGEWIENGRMPPERDLASEFGVARNTVRRAVSFLEDDGTVVRHVGRGTFLTATNPSSMAAVVGRMEGTSPADMMEIRQLLEPAAAAFAATNASAMELNAVREAHKIASESQDMPTFEHWDAHSAQSGAMVRNEEALLFRGTPHHLLQRAPDRSRCAAAPRPRKRQPGYAGASENRRAQSAGAVVPHTT